MIKVLILDSSGMVGHMISNYFNSLNKYKIINIAFTEKLNKTDITLDINDQDAVTKNILDKNPDIIINCFRILIKESEENPAKAIYFNSYFPHYLESLGGKNGIKIIYLSTDCVFSGKKGSYKEDDFKDGKGYYAQSKALGEIINNKDLTIRTSYIGPDVSEKGEELYHWFMMQHGTIKGYSKVFWTGVTTLELAKAIDAAIDQNLTGLYHLVPDKKISKYELLKLIKKIWKKNDVSIEEFKEKKVDKSLMNTRKDFNYKVKGYIEMLNELYEWMINCGNLYKYTF